MTPWMGDQPVARPVPTQDSTTQKSADAHPCLERDSNPLKFDKLFSRLNKRTDGRTDGRTDLCMVLPLY
jgi:hypothetical protein